MSEAEEKELYKKQMIYLTKLKSVFWVRKNE